MPVISRFFGIVVTNYWKEHGVPPFHAKHGTYRAAASIEDLQVLEGQLPSRARALVLEWASLHREELMSDWLRAQAMKPLEPIAPLE